MYTWHLCTTCTQYEKRFISFNVIKFMAPVTFHFCERKNLSFKIVCCQKQNDLEGILLQTQKKVLWDG